MKKYIVVCQQDIIWQIEVEASSQDEAINKVDEMIRSNKLSTDNADEVGQIETCFADLCEDI